ncbi:MAG TPA: hypothetical protein VGT98_07810 [Candidatus Elarobacter sp.]|nr:hypothetical protein [Candidatus Elarobacter sp.]
MITAIAVITVISATPLRAQTVAAPSAASDTISTDTARNRPVVNECAHAQPEWIFCDDFEADRLSRYFEYTHPHDTFARTPGTGVLGSTAMRAHFERGQVEAGSLKLAFGKTPEPYVHAVDSATSVFREIYWRMYVRTDSGWTGGGADKLSRAQVLGPAWAQAMGAPIWSGQDHDANYLMLDPYSGTDAAGTLRATKYNDFDRLRWLGAVRGRTPIFDAAHAGQWYCVEGHVRLNDPGVGNGIFEMWIDDVSEARRTGIDWVGSYAAYGINVVFFENYWNAGSPVAQSRYIDNIVVSTGRIGCGRITPQRDSVATASHVLPG